RFRLPTQRRSGRETRSGCYLAPLEQASVVRRGNLHGCDTAAVHWLGHKGASRRDKQPTTRCNERGSATSLTLTLTTPPMVTVYQLRRDNWLIKEVQKSSLNTKRFGVQQTYGLFASPQWWDKSHPANRPSIICADK